MKKYFKNRLEAVDWIASQAKSEAHFEVMREQLMYHYIYFKEYFIDSNQQNKEVVLIK